jgi:hypothetical protein
MPNSVAIEISDALAAGISAYEFSAPYASVDAVRRYLPDYEGPQLRTLQVSVVPGPVETERSSRGQDLFTHEIMVVIAKSVDGSNSDIDELTNLAEEMVDAIRSNLLVMPTMPENAKYFGAAMQTTFDRDSLMDRRVFLAQINVTYRVPRDHLTPTGV